MIKLNAINACKGGQLRFRLLTIFLIAGLIVSAFLPIWGCAKKKTLKVTHSDQDGIPDHIEKRLKTNPKKFDSDLDGQSDFYELVIEPSLDARKKSNNTSVNFIENVALAEENTGNKSSRNISDTTTTAYIQDIIAQSNKKTDWDKIINNPPDSDGDGTHNALDPSAGKEYEGLQDQDGDKIPDVYETYGFSWNHSTNQPVPWGFSFVSNASDSISLTPPDKLDYSIRYFKTNLHNAFSDWDAYDDYREASLNNIEATVLPPTNHPNVASIPNFNIVIDSATVTITADQIIFPSHSVLKGFKKKESFVHVEDNPFAKFFINLGAKSVSKTAKAYSEGIIDVDSKTIGSIIAEGIDLAIGPQYKKVADYETVVDVTDWLNASVDSAHRNNAASINLKWHLVNNGNDTAYDVQPTFNIMLGDNIINTYTLNTKIVSIGPHANSSTFFTSDINLSFDQLKAYMTGSLINTTINQISANVMTRHKIDEAPSKEDWSYFTNNMRTNSATITVDLGNGKLGTFKMLSIHPLGPSITLRDTLVWTIARYNDEGKNVATAVSEYFGNSSSNIPNFNDWTFYFSGGVDPNDPSTPKGITPNLDNILDTIILPGSTIYAKAPTAETPVVSWAKMSPVYDTAAEAPEITNMHQKKIDALVHDYFGVKTVSFGATPDATQRTVMTDAEGDGIYSLILPQDYAPTNKETIFVSRNQLLTSNPAGKEVITTAAISYTAPTGNVYSKYVDTLTLPKSGKDYGDVAFFDLENNKSYRKRGKFSASDAIDFAFGNKSDVSIDMNFYSVNKDSPNNDDYIEPDKYPVLGWYLSSSQTSKSNVCLWPDSKISYKKLSYTDISTTATTTKIDTDNSASKDKSKLQLSYTQKKNLSSTFSFMTNGGQWVKLQIITPYNLHSYKWRKWVRRVPLPGDPDGWEDFYDYYWRYQPKSVTINYTIYDKQP